MYDEILYLFYKLTLMISTHLIHLYKYLIPSFKLNKIIIIHIKNKKFF